MKRERGLVMLLITVLLCVLVLLTVALSLGQFDQQSGFRNITGKKVLQSYYVAMQGVQEALGTRMVPRSNQLNFRQNRLGGFTTFQRPAFPGGGPVPIMPYYNFSGIVLNNVRDLNPLNLANPYNPNNLFGVYRYVVVGGDAARNGVTGRYFDRANIDGIRSLTQAFYFPPNSSPFFIISNGITCVPQQGGAAQGSQIIINPYPRRPTCRPGFVIDETTLVARVLLEEPVNTGAGFSIRQMLPDRVTNVTIFRGNQQVRLPSPAFAPNGGAFIPGIPTQPGQLDSFVANDSVGINFEDIWQGGAIGRPNPPRLLSVLFYNAARSQRPIPPATATEVQESIIAFRELAPGENFVEIPATTRIPVTSTIRLFFNGPYDFRSLYRYRIEDCLDVPTLCNLQLVAPSAPGPEQQRDFNFVPLFPGLTSVLITPSFVLGQPHELRIAGVRNFNGEEMPPVTIRFTAEN
jgi:hypothetical protein